MHYFSATETVKPKHKPMDRGIFGPWKEEKEKKKLILRKIEESEEQEEDRSREANEIERLSKQVHTR